MPKVKRLGIQDRRETEVRSRIGAIMGALQVSEMRLAELAGIKPTTLNKRLRTDIGSMRLSELWAIEDVARFHNLFPDILTGERKGEKQ